VSQSPASWLLAKQRATRLRIFGNRRGVAQDGFLRQRVDFHCTALIQGYWVSAAAVCGRCPHDLGIDNGDEGRDQWESESGTLSSMTTIMS
jgi:hypothetical protein